MCELEHKFADFLPEDWRVFSVRDTLCFRDGAWSLDYSESAESKWMLTLCLRVVIFITTGDTVAEAAGKMIDQLRTARKRLDYVVHNVMKDKDALENRLNEAQKRGFTLINSDHYGTIFKKNELVVIYPCNVIGTLKGVGKTMSAAVVDLLNNSTQYLHNLNMFINDRPNLKEALERESEK